MRNCEINSLTDTTKFLTVNASTPVLVNIIIDISHQELVVVDPRGHQVVSRFHLLQGVNKALTIFLAANQQHHRRIPVMKNCH
mmetsp:Transcript_23659/g.65682  ORF Transcript_23659/g.65682 Transcript_23659/m.65682 type:complete len:83 (-) Transcript_23659:577-825(-)